MASAARRLPIVVILGATGAGKSKAALEVARKFNGEIISADSMQVYKGLDIVTNKVTREEQQQVPHHMIDMVWPLKSDFNIHNFRQMVIPKIERIHNDDKVPVIVGGTNYYIESILWDLLIGDAQSQDGPYEHKTSEEIDTEETSGEADHPSLETERTDTSGSVFEECQSHSDKSIETLSDYNDHDKSIVTCKTGHSDSVKEVKSVHRCGQTSVVLGSDDNRSSGVTEENADKYVKCLESNDSVIGKETDTRSCAFEHKLSSNFTAEIGGDSTSLDKGIKERGCGECMSKRKASDSGEGGRDRWSEMSSVDLHTKLKEVDPETAFRLHPHNRRKILRALEVYSHHQEPMSKMLKEQHNKEGASQVSGPLRYPNACVIWVQCEQNVLDERTDRRVEQMVADGLLEELQGFHREYNQQRVQENGEADYTLGIFQSIGFKEFHSYLLLTPDERKSEEGIRLFNKGLEDMKLATRKYARRQKRWIMGRFLKRRGLNVPPVYAVDSTNKEEWNEKVHKPACEIVEFFIQGNLPPYPPLPVEESKNQVVHNVCEVCGGRVFVTLDQWESHLASRRHQKNRERLRRKAQKGNQLNTVPESVAEVDV